MTSAAAVITRLNFGGMRAAMVILPADWHSAANRAVVRPFRARDTPSGILPRRLHRRGGAVVVAAANDAAPTQWRIPMAKLTDTTFFADMWRRAENAR